MSKLLQALVLITIANIGTWFQFQGHYWSDKPIFKSPLLIGFGMGTVVFGLMTWLLSNEIPTLKTFICLLLAVAIILIQVTNVADV